MREPGVERQRRREGGEGDAGGRLISIICWTGTRLTNTGKRILVSWSVGGFAQLFQGRTICGYNKKCTISNEERVPSKERQKRVRGVEKR